MCNLRNRCLVRKHPEVGIGAYIFHVMYLSQCQKKPPNVCTPERHTHSDNESGPELRPTKSCYITISRSARAKSIQHKAYPRILDRKRHALPLAKLIRRNHIIRGPHINLAQNQSSASPKRNSRAPGRTTHIEWRDTPLPALLFLRKSPRIRRIQPVEMAVVPRRHAHLELRLYNTHTTRSAQPPRILTR